MLAYVHHVHAIVNKTQVFM